MITTDTLRWRNGRLHYLLPDSLSAQVQLTDQGFPRYDRPYESTIGCQYSRAECERSQAPSARRAIPVHSGLTDGGTFGPSIIDRLFKLGRYLIGVPNQEFSGRDPPTGAPKKVSEG
jgi:hypothetical protein